IDAVAMRKIEVEYLTAAAGPTSHSPPPMDVAAMTAPGPITLSRLRRPKGGGAGSSSTSQEGSSPAVGGRTLASSRSDAGRLTACPAAASPGGPGPGPTGAPP